MLNTVTVIQSVCQHIGCTALYTLYFFTCTTKTSSEASYIHKIEHFSVVGRFFFLIQFFFPQSVFE